MKTTKKQSHEPLRIFGLDKDQLIKLNEWIKTHDKTCPYANPLKQGAIGGRLSYEFTPSSLGTFAVVKCACKAECNVTDYDAF
jgi:hypothetical protein